MGIALVRALFVFGGLLVAFAGLLDLLRIFAVLLLLGLCGGVGINRRAGLMGILCGLLSGMTTLLLVLTIQLVIGVVFPESVDLRVASTAQPMHQRETSALKKAVLENGMEVQVPLFHSRKLVLHWLLKRFT
jgi:hypothetical protein